MLTEGHHAPIVSLPNQNGESVVVLTFRGKVVPLMPLLEALAR